MDKPLLILDLDETLIWATQEKPVTGFDFRAFSYYVTKRPHLPEFLDRISGWYRVAIWTSAGDDYADLIVKEIFADSSKLDFVWAASRCIHCFEHSTQDSYLVKDLKKVKKRGYPLERVVIIDDSPEKVARNYGNHLPIRPFEGDPEDRELMDVLPFLEWLKNQQNFRKI